MSLLTNLSKKRTLFGIHEVTPYSRLTGLPYGALHVLSGSSLNISGEIVELSGGSNPYSWDAQDGLITAEISLKPREFPSFLSDLLLGIDPTEQEDDTGTCDEFANVNGTSCYDASTGITTASVESGEEDELKFGKYIVKVVSATTVDVYALTSVDFRRGTDLDFQDDDLKITASALTIATDTAVSIPNTGVELTGGSGTIGMTTGDTAEFRVSPPSNLQSRARIGGMGNSMTEFGAVVTAQKKADGSMWLFDLFRIKALGFPFGMEAKAWNEAEITGKILYDSVKDGIFDMEYIEPSSGIV